MQFDLGFQFELPEPPADGMAGTALDAVALNLASKERIAAEHRVFQRVVPLAARALMFSCFEQHGCFKPDALTSHKDIYCFHVFDNGGLRQEGFSLGIVLRPAMAAELAAMGCRAADPDLGQISDRDQFRSYWQRNALIPHTVGGIILREQLAVIVPATEAAAAPDTLHEEVLHTTIPDHLGHSVCAATVTPAELAAKIRHEGNEDRGFARTLWSLMTEFWQNPSPETLLSAYRFRSTHGDWVNPLMGVEFRQRGGVLPLLLEWCHVCNGIGLLESEFDSSRMPASSEPNLNLCELLLEHLIATCSSSSAVSLVGWTVTPPGLDAWMARVEAVLEA